MTAVFRLRSRLRAFWACVAVIAVFAALTGGGAAAYAAPDLPTGPMTLVLHKYAQPEVPGSPVDGLPIDPAQLAGLAPIGGVDFAATFVPGIDLSTDEGRAAAAALTPAEAALLVAGQPATATARTDVAGEARMAGLRVGLYYVSETSAPPGVLRAAPFLVPLPMASPDSSGAWLTTVHVYPKNPVVDVTLTVRDRDAISCGDTVSWSSLSAIPRQAQIASYRLQHLMPLGVVLDSAFPDVAVSLTGAGALVFGDDYTISSVDADGLHGFETVFTAQGLAKLAAHPEAQLAVDYNTHVTSMGEFTTEVRLFAGNADPVRSTATTKFGPLGILVSERGDPGNLIKGADFELFLTSEDARSGSNPISVGGVSAWSTDADGLIMIGCLRLSNFADGLDRAPGSALFRFYFAAPTSYPAGWTGETMVLRGVVGSVSRPEILHAEVWRAYPASPPPLLSVTGGRIVGGLLLGAVLLGVGALLLGRRRANRAVRG
ncbi:SpaH/EbpB family LPXTG-anchored major pilin [Leucobacter sp. VD1]|uniref:SpaH/EbpB family LPXTG-anchored major pilin n=1 Tax=Leucobacter sp. VD1 TaxID=3080381 RepID=UPI003017818D